MVHLHDFKRLRALFLFCLSISSQAMAGCGPQEQWLDDSSGFVYGFSKDDQSREVRFYDIVERADHVVWTGNNEAGGCLDSAAKALFVIESKRGGGKLASSCRLSAFDLKSNRLPRSTRWMSWAQNNLESGRLVLAKIPHRTSHFVVLDSDRKGSFRSAILNAATETLIDVPEDLMDIVPDGSGLIGNDPSVIKTWHESLRSKKELEPPAIEKLCREFLWIVDLDGNRHRLSWNEAAVRRVVVLYGEELQSAKARARPRDETDKSLVPNAWLTWQSDIRDNQKPADATILLYGDDHGAMRIDAKHRTVTEATAAEVAKAKQDIAARSGANTWSPGGGLELHGGVVASPARSAATAGPPGRIIKLNEVEYWARVLEDPTRKTLHYVVRVEARWPVNGKTRMLLDRVVVDGLPTADKSSPDGHYAVIKYEEPKKDNDDKRSRIHFIIVDDTGNIVDSLAFVHFDNDQSFKLQPFLPDEPAEKRE